MLHFNVVGVGIYDKIGGGPPSPWCFNGEEQVAQLLRRCRHPPQVENGVYSHEAQESSDETWLQSDDGERRASDMVTRQKK